MMKALHGRSVWLLRLLLAPGQRVWLEAMVAELDTVAGRRERARFFTGLVCAVLRLSARRVTANANAWAISLVAGVLIPLLDTHRGGPCLLVLLLVTSCGALSFAVPDAPWRWAVALLATLAIAPFHVMETPFVDRAELPAILTVVLVVAYAGAGLRWLSDRHRRLAPLAFMLLLLPSTAIGQDRTNGLRTALDSMVRAEVQRSRVPGAAVLVERAGVRLLDQGYGVTDLNARAAVVPSTVFPIGSITKQFTAVAVLKQVVAGRISLDESIAGSFPDARLDRRVTIRHLLNHTSGLPRYEQLIPNVTSFARQNIRPDTVLHYIAGKELVFEPGSRWAYVNTGYHLLGLLLEQRTGLPYFEQLQRDVLIPMNLRSTRACVNAGADARGYDLEENGPELVPPLGPSLPFSAGGLCSTTGDLAVWLRALTRGLALPPDVFRTMTAPTLTAGGSREAYGFGLMLGDLSGHRFIAHGGSLPGYDSFAARYADDDLTIIILANGRPFDSEGLQKRLARRVLGIPEPSVVDLPITAVQRAAYVGTYDAGVAQVRIVEAGDRLKLQGPGDFPLLYQGEQLFVAREDPDLKVQFVLNGGNVTGLVLTARGRQYQARRL